MRNLYDFTHDQLEEEMLLLEQKRYRATQLFGWINDKKVGSFDEMSDVSLRFREVLKSRYELRLPTIFSRQDAVDGTIKLLLEMADGAKVECVLMRYEYGNVLCVSSQVGCNMGCTFCASGLLRKQRNLATHELVAQLLVMQSLLDQERISHVVVMGTGEPFDNYDAVMDFIKILNHPKGLAIGARHITVSTCGLVEGIRKYAEEKIQINLAISLHAPNDVLRSQLMRINQAYPLGELIAALQDYQAKTKRRITFEYIMLRGINDQISHAIELAHLSKQVHAYVNLIPYNEIKELPYHRSSKDTTRLFVDALKTRGINVTVRKEFGMDIDAACGQLRSKVEAKR